MAANEAEGSASVGSVRLGDRYEIYPDRPLPELRSGNAVAVAAGHRERHASSLFALVGDPSLAPRQDVMSALQGLRADGVMVPHHWGVIDWAPAGRRCFATIFERPAGGRLVPLQASSIEPLHEDDIIHNVLPSLAACLRELFAAGLTHRAIRPSNLFYRDSTRRGLVLGECVSVPPAALQPIAYEPIESGMALPAGRGPGSPADDLYALGATLLFLLLGRSLGAGLTDEQLLADKIARGSFYALLGEARVGGAMVELLRGLLNDDPRERWTIQDLEMWLGGRRTSAKHPAITRRAARPFEFSGGQYYAARPLAAAFARDPVAALRALKGTEFEVWMQRSLCDEERSKMLAVALAESRDGGAGQDERLVGRVCVALDPAAPVRYKGFAATIDGFGPALAAACQGQGSIQTIVEAMSGRLPQFWFSAQAELKPEHVPILKIFERLRLHLDDRRPGYGVERVLYEMNPSLHCLSPLVEGEYVLDPADMLKAIERVSARRTGDDFQVDRHLAAFLAVRFRTGGNDWYDALHSTDPTQRVLGTLYLLARLQGSTGPAQVPSLAQRIARQIPAAIDRYHNRGRRARLKAELARTVAKGNLGDMLNLIDSSVERQRDAQGFSQAQRDYAAIHRDLELLRIEAPRRPERAGVLGARYAATASSLLAWMVALFALVVMS